MNKKMPLLEGYFGNYLSKRRLFFNKNGLSSRVCVFPWEGGGGGLRI